MIKCIWVSLFFFFFFFEAKAQNRELSKSKMYADFDLLMSTLEGVSPHLYLKQQITGYAALDTIKSFRKEIESIKNYDEFWELIQKSLTTCQDGHTHIATDNGVHNQLYEGLKLSIPIKYIDGHYLIIREFKYKGTHFLPGWELLSANGQSISRMASQVVPYRSNMKIDVSRGEFYFDNLLFSDNLIRKGTIELTFRKEDGTELTQVFSYNESVEFVSNNVVFEDSQRVEYWEDLKVLYVRMPSMRYDQRKFYSKEIMKVGKGKEIKGVIIDVRFNGGGSDFTWMNALRALMNKPFQVAHAVYGNEPSHISSKYRRIHGIRRAPKEEISFLNNYVYYPYQKDTETLKPFRNSLNLDCKIAVVGNDYIYSSTGSLFSATRFSKTDSLISIGTTTGNFQGRGFDPILFELPNSKIKYHISPTIDLWNCSSVQDIMHDTYDFLVFPTLSDYKLKYDYNGNVWSKEFMVEYDPYIVKALKEL
jgi:hypothetical protein